MKPGSTVYDSEVAANISRPSGPFHSSGGYSNIFKSDCYYLYSDSDTDNINNSGCLITRDLLLRVIRRLI